VACAVSPISFSVRITQVRAGSGWLFSFLKLWFFGRERLSCPPNRQREDSFLIFPDPALAGTSWASLFLLSGAFLTTWPVLPRSFNRRAEGGPFPFLCRAAAEYRGFSFVSFRPFLPARRRAAGIDFL